MSNSETIDDRYTFAEANTQEISFPLGGLGTGCIGLSGSGRLVDWEIYNRPNKGSVNAFSHFAVKAERDHEVIDARLLHGDYVDSLNGEYGRVKFFEGFGWGPIRETLVGMPHFQHHEFRGEFPFAEITFTDAQFPGSVKLLAFNPFIPTNDKDSGIPAAMFEICVTNTSDERLRYTLVGTIGNPFTSQSFNELQSDDPYHLLHLGTDTEDKKALEYGDLTLATDAEDCSYQEYWHRGIWGDPLEIYWRDLNTPGKFENRQYARGEKAEMKWAAWHDLDNGDLAAHFELDPSESKRIRFVIAWNFPNQRNYWSSDTDARAEAVGLKNAWKNYYATFWEDSIATAPLCAGGVGSSLF